MDFQYNKVTEITGERDVQGFVLKYQDQEDEDEDKGKEKSLKEAQEKGSLYINTSSDPDRPKWTPVNKIDFVPVNSPILEYENKETVKSAMDKGILYIGPTRAELDDFNKIRAERFGSAEFVVNHAKSFGSGGKRNKSRKPKRRNSRSKRRKTLNKSRH